MNQSRKIDNKGFTLVELLISISISVIVIGIIAFFMESSTRNYRRANEEISLQMEAQTVMNQLNNLILEAYNVKFRDNVLMIYKEEEGHQTIHRITYDSNEHVLEFEKVPAGRVPTGNTQLLGRYVEAFQVTDTGSDNSNSQVKVTLDLKRNSQTYSIKDSIITLRNKIKPVN